MKKIFSFIKWALTLGEPQNFLGAKWITIVLDRVPASSKRIWALRILSLSPHYFFRDPHEHAGLSFDEYLEAEFNRCVKSRAKLYEHLLKNKLNESSVVLDYGCGPGFLARAVAPHVEKVYATDISTGALACAETLNGASNVEYVVADAAGLSKIPDQSVDAVYSFALAQHLTDATLGGVLEHCRNKLKPEGQVVFHVKLEDPTQRSEAEWRSDRSVQGRIKYRYGLHVFGRTLNSLHELFAEHGFTNVRIEPIASLVDEPFDHICSQHLLTATSK